MLQVTLPSGKSYTYANRNHRAARALADKTGGTVRRFDAQLDSECDCGRPSCRGCDDVFDAMRDGGYFEDDYYNSRWPS